VVRVGISDFARDQLGDIVFLDLPAAGRTVARDEAFGVIESVKAVEDLHAPVGGEIVEVNEALLDEPEIVGEDPYDRGWMVALRAGDPAEMEALMDAAAYVRYCEEAETT
jgi:glycine cleavage system H protein